MEFFYRDMRKNTTSLYRANNPKADSGIMTSPIVISGKEHLKFPLLITPKPAPLSPSAAIRKSRNTNIPVLLIPHISYSPLRWKKHRHSWTTFVPICSATLETIRMRCIPSKPTCFTRVFPLPKC